MYGHCTTALQNNPISSNHQVYITASMKYLLIIVFQTGEDDINMLPQVYSMKTFPVSVLGRYMHFRQFIISKSCYFLDYNGQRSLLRQLCSIMTHERMQLCTENLNHNCARGPIKFSMYRQ